MYDTLNWGKLCLWLHLCKWLWVFENLTYCRTRIIGSYSKIVSYKSCRELNGRSFGKNWSLGNEKGRSHWGNTETATYFIPPVVFRLNYLYFKYKIKIMILTILFRMWLLFNFSFEYYLHWWTRLFLIDNLFYVWLVGYIVIAHGSHILCICTNVLGRCMLKRQDKLHREKKNIPW